MTVISVLKHPLSVILLFAVLASILLLSIQAAADGAVSIDDIEVTGGKSRTPENDPTAFGHPLFASMVKQMLQT